MKKHQQAESSIDQDATATTDRTEHDFSVTQFVRF